MVAKKKTDPTPVQVAAAESKQMAWPEVQSLPPALIDLFARVIMSVQPEEIEAYVEIVKEHQEALLRALDSGSWSGNHS